MLKRGGGKQLKMTFLTLEELMPEKHFFALWSGVWISVSSTIHRDQNQFFPALSLGYQCLFSLIPGPEKGHSRIVEMPSFLG